MATLGRLLALILVAGLVGCMSGDDSGPLTAEDAPDLVLQPDDLPAGYVQFDLGPSGRADSYPRANADPARFDRLDGWKARYRLPGNAEGVGPAVIDSRVDVFENEAGAEADFAELQEGLRSTLNGADVEELPDFGDEAVVATLVQGTGQFASEFVYLAWREANATGFLTFNGGESLSLGNLVGLARKQEQRIAAQIGR